MWHQLAHKKIRSLQYFFFLFEIIVKKFLLVEKKCSTDGLYHKWANLASLLIQGSSAININDLTGDIVSHC